MAVVIPISMAVCIIPTAFVFHYVFYANLPESIWGIEDDNDINTHYTY